MNTATNLTDASQAVVTVTDQTTSTAIADAHVSALAVPTVKIDQINNWTGADELPFDPIAERVLDMQAQDEQGDHNGALSVTFARPIEIAGKGWACVFRMSAMGRVHVSPARGVDAVDAIQAAFAMVHRQLTGMRQRHQITFGGTENLGFAAETADRAPKAVGCPVMGGTLG